MSSLLGSVTFTRIELVTKDNYDTWKIHTEASLIKQDEWIYVCGAKPRPGEGDAMVASDIADKKAKSDLILSISPFELKQVRGCVTSRELWLKLESVMLPKDQQAIRFGVCG